MPLKTKIWIGSVIGVGAAVVASALLIPGPVDGHRLALFVALAAIASAIRFRLPSADGSYSLNAVVLLVAAVYYSFAETVVTGFVAGAVATLAAARERPQWVRVLFNAAGEASSLAVCWLASRWLAGFVTYQPALLAFVAALYFVINTMLVSTALSQLEGKRLWEVGRQWYFWSFPVYLSAAAVIGLLPLGKQRFDATSLVVLLPLAYLLHFFCGLSLYCPRDEGTKAEGSGIPARARVFVALVVVAGVSSLVSSLVQWESANIARFVVFFALAILTATWKVRLPGLMGAISVNYVVVLFAIASMSWGEAMVMSAAGAVVQSLWRPKQRPKAIQVWFNFACFTLCTGITYWLCRVGLALVTESSLAVLLAIATATHYGLNTVLVAAVLTLVEGRRFAELWRNCHFWAFPHYIVGAVAAGLMTNAGRTGSWMQPLLIVPLLAMVCISYVVQIREHSLAVDQPA